MAAALISRMQPPHGLFAYYLLRGWAPMRFLHFGTNGSVESIPAADGNERNCYPGIHCRARRPLY